MRGKRTGKKKKSGLLLQHLEDVSWKVLDDYRAIVRDMIRGRSGVYALYNRRKLYYVGLADNPQAHAGGGVRGGPLGKPATISFLSRVDFAGNAAEV